MRKLFIADLKMLVRNRQSLFWSLMFPLMFTVIFGLFFGKNSTGGTVALIKKSNSEIANNLEKAIGDSDLFKIRNEDNLQTAKDEIKKSQISAAIEIPEHFGEMGPGGTTQLIFIYDPGNIQASLPASSFLDSYITSINFKIQNAKSIYSVENQKINTRDLTYFDFVLAGILGLALMNSSVIGISIAMSKYREDKILKRITTTPLETWKFIGAEVLSRLMLNIFQIGLILVVGVYLFNGHIYGNIFILFGIAMLGAILFQLLGFVVSILVSSTDAAQGMATAITIPMMFLAGVFFPIDALPKWLSSIVQYLPLAPLLRMIRFVALDNISPFVNPFNIIVVLAWIVLLLAIAVWKFRLSEE